eukprot:1714757-Ditylum_brightwellii.AAC.2
MATEKLAFPATMELLKDPNVWIGDTGASCNSTGDYTGMMNRRVVPENDGVTMPNDGKSTASMIADIDSVICDKNGKQIEHCKIANIKYCRGNAYNLFSIPKRLKNRWHLHGNSEAIWITKGEQKLVFDTVIPTKEGLIFAVYIKRKVNTEMANAGTDPVPQVKMNINKAHDLLGHADEDKTHAMAKHLQWTILRGGMKTCEACAVGKAKQKNVPKK